MNNNNSVNSDDTLNQFIKSALPWSAYLPEDEYTRFINDLRETLAECSKNSDYSELSFSLLSWHETAKIWNDDELLKRLLTPIEERIDNEDIE